MTKVIVLDAGPLGMLANPKPRSNDCKRWADALLDAGHSLILPEIADYEVRRELVLSNRVQSLELLDRLGQELRYLPLTTADFRAAAKLWAEVRRQGRPTAPNYSLDADVILAAQTLHLNQPNTVIATTNVAHLSRFTAAALWSEILP